MRGRTLQKAVRARARAISKYPFVVIIDPGLCPQAPEIPTHHAIIVAADILQPSPSYQSHHTQRS